MSLTDLPVRLQFIPNQLFLQLPHYLFYSAESKVLQNAYGSFYKFSHLNFLIKGQSSCLRHSISSNYSDNCAYYQNSPVPVNILSVSFWTRIFIGDFYHCLNNFSEIQSSGLILRIYKFFEVTFNVILELIQE